MLAEVDGRKMQQYRINVIYEGNAAVSNKCNI